MCWDPTSLMTLQRQTYKDGPLPPGTPVAGSVWYLKCETGYMWADTSLLKTINCTGTNWTKIPEACIRMFFGAGLILQISI